MRSTFDQKSALFLGVSVIAMAVTAPAATAQSSNDTATPRTLGTVVVTSQKTEESIQDVPIAVSAFDQSALEKLQLTGGPDLVKSIPNVNFTKGNFSGFNFRIRGIGVDAVSTSGDAGVGVHINDAPVNANRLFEAEFFDVERIETLRGPQGTLYGRNATGGVVNIITAKPVLEEFQANAQLTYGNFNTLKARGMVNLPLGELAALRVAGSYLSRDGFVDNIGTGNEIDDRDLYSIRATLAFEPTDRFRGWILYEHFEEEDTRLRSGKQFCATDPIKTSFQGIPISAFDQLITSQGCVDEPLTANESLGGVNTASTLGGGLAIFAGLTGGIDPVTGNAVNVNANGTGINADFRTINAAIDPSYEASQDFISWRGEFDITDSLTAIYLGSYNETEAISQEDYNKFQTSVPFNTTASPFIALSNPALAPLYPLVFPGGVVSDPQLGPSNLLVSFDLSGAVSEETTHELRLQSDFDGPFNFNVGAIKVDFETNDTSSVPESYYVFSNSLTAFTQLNNAGAVAAGGEPVFSIADPANAGDLPLDNLGDGTDRNYFRSITPYTLDSFAILGEGYFDATDDLTFTLGLRYTSDDKEVIRVPTFLFVPDAALPDPLAGIGVEEASFEETTGRFGFDWNPDLDFSEDSLFYAFYSRGYKGGGINPPQPAESVDVFPAAFDPEFVDAFEIGTKNTLAGGALQLNATGFYYDYQGYQITQIINRTSANFNVDAEISGFELETIWNPTSTLILSANLGLLDAQIVDTFGIDVLDRTNGRDDLVVLKDAGSFANCVVSAAGYATVLGAIQGGLLDPGSTLGLCTGDLQGLEAGFGLGDVTVSYVDSNGETQTATAFQPFDGEAKNLDGNNLPGTPDMTFSFGAEYTFEGIAGGDWDARLRGDFYYQGESFSRIWNTGRDELESWSNVNLGIKFTNVANGWSVEAFGKNITDEDVITGAYLTDDSSGLYSNVFLNEPATYGVTLAKSW
ncbi:MAG: TonB-dependent receptor [Pseudomonadota bacterium]